MAEPHNILVPQEIVNDTSVRVVRLAAVTGKQVALGDLLVELETSKSNIDVESPASGWLQMLIQEGEDVQVGSVLGRIFESEMSLEAASVHSSDNADSSLLSLEMEPSITVFSQEARFLMESAGMDEIVFADRAFVRASDVKAVLENDLAPKSGEFKQRPELATDSAFQQTLGDEWSVWSLVRSDLHRINGRHDKAEFFRQWFWNPGFSYVLWFRVAQWSRKRNWARFLIYPIAALLLYHRHLQSGIRIPLSVRVGPGLLIGHWGSIWVSPRCTLGANCTFGNDVNLGSAGSGGDSEVPQLGDNVFIGPGSRLAGALKIGSQTAVMANTLVTHDVPPGSIVMGVPHRVTGRHGNNSFVSHTDYPCP